MNRRAFLMGLGGVVFALPLLESVPPSRRVAHADGAPTKRPLFLFRQANGVQQSDRHWATDVSEPENFWPRAVGPLTEASVMGRTLDELRAHLPRLLVVDGFEARGAGVSCAHTSGCNAILTAAAVERYGGMNETHALGPSIDNLIAEQNNPAGRGPLFFQAGPSDTWAVAGLSYVGPRMRRNPDFNPIAKYREIMGMGPPRDLAGEQRLLQRRSVNDLVREQMQWLIARPYLSADDRRRLEIHRANVRDAEIAMAQSCALAAEAEASLASNSTRLFGTTGSPLWSNHTMLHEMVRLQIDVAVLALTCGFTKVALLSVGGYSNGTLYQFAGLPMGGLSYHRISHRATTDGDPRMEPSAMALPEAWQYHHQIDRLHARDFAYLIDKLAGARDANGSLLEQGLAVWLSDMGAGSHVYKNLPVVCAGSAGGFLRTGQYVSMRAGAEYTPHNKLLNTLVSATGIRKPDGSLWDDFGPSTLPRGVATPMLAAP